MKFIVDAQLPRRLARELSSAGHDTLHTLAHSICHLETAHLMEK
jgi:predicted nuclease of predicted toxin-antitoxin system